MPDAPQPVAPAPQEGSRSRRIYTIGELSKLFEVTPRTIRFYEQEGLLEPERRGQTRIYHDKDRVRLKLTLRGKRLGFSLAEIREVIQLYDRAPDGDERQLRRMLDILADKRAAMQQQLEDIRILQRELDDVESRCQESLQALTRQRTRC
ncbi:MerR family DNA-binding transcriptional regulator [Halomonas sp. McH1-25]|uniref:MerR family transcriptional regulator n=1 Tax=unclassified Halomonas TaxID=2609666 RepID=UPI001EF60074|nr:MULTISPECIES: MerR family DNA-binding transcriptional regulator [unclassified Halomonas]MCG7598707.1 MerR family DNA-binding transcriptional regulator [Halomonas sp. McH1-25]MCP1340670.1 MerR family DNA-binding transcriptional regulator [Halomonas sp. FL8]MCP1359441.1 MerR family DNA-binding transcriptional regulator [Halomonas sp. BBD45]